MKKFIAFLSSALIITALPLSCSYAPLTISALTAEERYAAYTPIDSVIQQNEEKIQNIKEYSAEFVVDYIVEGGSCEEVEDVLNQIQSLSDEICSGIDNDYDKMRAIHDYVSATISYDLDAAHNSVTFDVICLKNVLERQRTTCAGYSNLFSALCQAQGLYAINIRGCSPEGDIHISNLDSEDAVTNHEWTAVYYDAEQRWVYVDCTWDSRNRFQNGEFSMKDFYSIYFDISLYYLSIEHKAQIVQYRNFFTALDAFPQEVTSASETVITSETQSDTAPAESTQDTPSPTDTPDNTSPAAPQNTTAKNNPSSRKSADNSNNSPAETSSAVNEDIPADTGNSDIYAAIGLAGAAVSILSLIIGAKHLRKNK